jgi:lambda family phage tail tape measure protein
MSNLETQIAISADASGVETGVVQAKKSLSSLGKAAADAGKQAADGVKVIGAGGEEAAKKVDRSTQSLIGSIQRTTAALEAGSRSTADYYRELANQRGVDANLLAPYLAALDNVQTKQKLAKQGLEATTPVVKQLGVSAAQTAAALRGVPAQFTDIVTSLQGGQAPLTVLLQQGGQLKDMFGGVGNATKALGGYILGLVNPITLTIAAVSGLSYAFYEGSQEQAAFQKGLIATGNISGTTAGQLQVMAQSISGIVGTQGAAAEALNAFAQSGAVGADSLERYTLAAIQFQRATGTAVSETIQRFSELKKAPLEASLKLNETTNYLTESVYRQIRALTEQGQATEAANLAQKAYADTLSERSSTMVRQLGFIERSWIAVKDAVKGAGDALLSIGRVDGIDAQASNIKKQLENLRASVAETSKGTTVDDAYQTRTNKALISTLEQKLALLEKGASYEALSAKYQGEQARHVAALVQWDKSGEQFTTKAAKMQQEITRARNEGAAAGAKQADIEARIADIRKKYLDKGDFNSGKSLANAKAELDVQAIQKAVEAQVGAYANGEKLLDAVRSAGLVSEGEYYAAKRAYVEINASAQDKAFAEEIAREKQRKAIGSNKAEIDLAQIEINKKVLDLEAKRAKASADSATNLQVLAIQQNAALASTTRAYEEARQAAQAYLDTTARGYARELDAFGRGDAARSQAAGRNQIEDKYSAQAQDISNKAALDKDQSPENQDRYRKQLDLISEFRGKALEGWDDYYTKLEAMQGDWSKGASRAVENYLESAGNSAKQTENLLTNAFKGAEDALTNFVTTGKLSFEDFTKSVLADLARIQIQKALAGVASNAGDIFSKFIASANGNVFESAGLSKYSGQVVNTPTVFPFAKGVGLMGEAGPEAIMPLSRTANGKLGVSMAPGVGARAGGGDISIQVNVDASGSSAEGNSDQAKQLGAMLGSSIRAVLIQEKRPGGILA